MKKIYLIIALTVAIVSCNKTTNNTTVITPLPAFTVNGITDVTLTNGTSYYISMPLTVAYDDSTQETVTLSVSGLPAGVTMDSTWVTTGIPTFSTELSLSDTLDAGANPGTYPITITATGSNGGKKSFQFNLNVVSPASCTSNVVGVYSICASSCFSSTTYSDNVTADANITNKIWFANVYGIGLKLFGYYNCNTRYITIPAQTVSGVTYYGVGTASVGGSSHYINMSVTSSNSGTCNVSMN